MAVAAMNASAAEKADRSVRTMSQEDKIGQLMCIGLEGTTFDELQKELVRKYRVGGIVLDNDNMESKEQVRAFTKGIRDTAIRRIAFSNGLTDTHRPVHIARVRVKRVGIHHDTQIEIEPKVAHLNGRARR